MVALRYRDEHNKAGYLLKPTGSDYYHQIIDFMRASHLRYALTLNPIIFDSLVKQFWSTATLRSPELADGGGIDDLPITKICSRMDNLGTNFGSWDQFGSPITVALICLSDGRRFNWSSYIFKRMVSNIGNAKKFLMHPMPLLPVMLLQAPAGEGAGVAAQAIPQHMPALDQPQDHLSTPIRRQTSDPNAPVFEHGQSSDLNTASFSRSHETDAGPFTNVDDEPLEGSFHMSPPSSTQAPPAGQPSGGAEDPITLTALSFVVSTLVQEVKSLEVKLRTKRRKMVVSDSDQEEGEKQDVNLDALRALANAAVTVDSNIPPGDASNTPTSSPSVPTDVPPSVAPVGVSNKGKALMVDEDILFKERTFKQMEEDRLGEEAAKRLHDEEQAQVDRQRAELQRRRQHEVLDSAMYYTEADWIHIMAQVEANTSLPKTLLGDDVTEDNFPARMAALIKMKKQALAEKLAKERRNRPMTQAQQRTYMRQFVVSTEDSNDEALPVWFALVGWENLYMVDRQDLVKLYGLVVQYYETHPVAGARLILCGDLQEIRSWRLYTLSNVHVLETVSSEMLSMFADVSYPLSVKFMEKMLRHKLEIDTDVVGNDMTTAEQLI
nr:JmjC domain-containing protein [Tanacetum cinerariifolium]